MFIYDTPLLPVNIFIRSSSFTQELESKSSLIFELNQPINIFPNMEVLVNLKSFSFTNSFYNINTNNNVFIYTFDNITFQSFVLEVGNYSIDDLIQYFNDNLSGFTLSYSTSTFKITMRSNVIFRIGNGTINEVLGHDDIVLDTSLETIKISKYPFNLITNQILNITLPNISLESIDIKNLQKHNTLESIQVLASAGEVQHYQSNSDFKYKVSNNVISDIHIKILNQDYQIVDFNNIDYFMTISFNFVYKKELSAAQYLTENNQLARFFLLEEKERQLLLERNNNL